MSEPGSSSSPSGWARSHLGNIELVGRSSRVCHQLTQILAKSALRAFWEEHPRSRAPLEAWHGIVDKASWAGPADVKATFGTTVDFVADNRIIFDIGGNRYRLVVHVAYRFGKVLIEFVGTHRQYDKIDPGSVP